MYQCINTFDNTSWNTKQNKADDTYEVVGEWGVFFGDIYCLQQLCAEAQVYLIAVAVWR